MFNFHLYNGSLPYRVFMALTVAFCIWGIMSLTADAVVVSIPETETGQEEMHGEKEMGQTEGIPIYHVHEGDPVLGTGCYAGPVYHKHTGSKKKGTGCYGKAVLHNHSGSAQDGSGCYGQSIFHVHYGDAQSGGGCYGQAIKHVHGGSAQSGGGCYGKALFHEHRGDEVTGGACYATPVYHQHEGVDGATSPGGCYTREIRVNVAPVCGTFLDVGNEKWQCHNCGWTIPADNVPYDKKHWPQVMETRYTLGCNKTNEDIDGYALSCPLTVQTVEGYELSCGKNEGAIEGYQLSCGKNETSVEGYDLNCGFQEGQIVEYKRNCGMTTEDVIGYELSCGMDEQTIVGIKQPEMMGEPEETDQPVKVPITLMQTEDMEDMTPLTGPKQLPEVAEEKEVLLQNTQVAEPSKYGGILLIAATVLVVGVLLSGLYFAKTVPLYYYDDRNQYHSLGRIGYRRNGKGYHVEIGNNLRKKATTDRYRIRTSKGMQKDAKDAHLFVRISTQVMKLGLEEYVDFAL